MTRHTPPRQISTLPSAEPLSTSLVSFSGHPKKGGVKLHGISPIGARVNYANSISFATVYKNILLLFMT
jgi:mevalonate pyrophosphate decarboxylase